MAVQATLGIDLGTSGVRAVVMGGAHLRDGGEVAGMCAVRLDAAARRDPARLWAAVAEVLDGLDLSAVGALAVDGTSGTLVAVQADGRPASGLSLYSDAPPPGTDAPVIARAIALQARPNAVRILHEADWVTGQFSGQFDITDENNALKTGYDPVARAWPDRLDQTGLRRAMLPRVVAPGVRIGQVTADAARRFGLPVAASVAAGTTDGCASFLATGADCVGDGVTALGSTMTLKLLAPTPVLAAEYGIYSHRLGDQWLPGGASNTGGAALARFFTPEEITALSERIDPALPSPFDYYPLPAPGERFPVNDPAMQPHVTPRPADDAAFLHGLLEGIARIEALGYQRLSELGAPPVRRVLTTGGGGGNDAWTKIRARVLGVPVTSAHAEAAQGTAMLARLALR